MAYDGNDRRKRSNDHQRKEGGSKGYGRKDARPAKKDGDFSKKRDDRRRDSRSKGNGRSRGNGRPHDDKNHSERPREVEQQQEQRKLLLPQDASKLLYRGIDCQVNGNDNLAMIMFLHGSVMMSEGCQNNAVRILREKGKTSFVSIRTDIAPNCSPEALIEFDYLCSTLDGNYDRSYFDRMYSDGNTHAIYRRICLEEVDGTDPVIDEFASRYPEDDKKVIRGLELLIKKKDSETAQKHLDRINDGIQLKHSINVMFTRAMNGDARAVQELKRHAKDVPEAAFYSEYLAAREKGENVEWLRSKYPQYSDLIVSRQGEFKIQDTPFGMFLKAKNLEMKKEEYISVMMNAAKAGSPEAMDELSKKMFRNDVRKCLASIRLKEGDLPGLVAVYDAGLDDQYYLDQYCGDDPKKMIEVGDVLGRNGIGREIDWLKSHYEKGYQFCRDELVSRSKDERYQSKRMVYALHDIGADMDAAKLYFAMEGNPELPSVKWLKKVCSDDEVLDFVREHYEDLDDMRTFEFIFADDGYEKRPKGQGRGKKPGKRRYRTSFFKRTLREYLYRNGCI